MGQVQLLPNSILVQVSKNNQALAFVLYIESWTNYMYILNIYNYNIQSCANNTYNVYITYMYTHILG